MSRLLGPCLNLGILIFALNLSTIHCNVDNNLTTIVDPTAEGFGKQVCVTKECAQLSAMLILNMDEKVKPCDDFTGFVCGNYDINYYVKPGQDYHTPAHTISQVIHTRLQLLFEAPLLSTDKPWHTLTKTFYQKCIDKAAIRATRKETIRTLLNEIGALIEPGPQEIMYDIADFGADPNFYPQVTAFYHAFVKKYNKIYSSGNSEPQIGPLKLMKARYKNFDLETYVQRLLDGIIPVSPDLTVKIYREDIFERLHTVVNNKRGLANFVGFKAVVETYSLFMFNCIDYMADAFIEPVAQMYHAKHFDYDGVAPKIKGMISLVRESLHEMINNATWLDDPTRQNAIKKLKEMQEIVAFSDTLFNDTIMNQKWNIPFDPTDRFYTLSARVDQKKLANELAELNQISKFDMVDNTVNAYYLQNVNGIYVGAPILELPYYQSNVPDYVNFAGIGHVIAHEFMHGFDNEGRLYDEKGNVRIWWTKKTSDKYDAKTQCYVEQYDNHGLNGAHTLGENIGDNVGAKVSYYAYKKYMARRGVETEPALPGFEKYTLDQMFFMLQAHKMCDVMTKGPLRNPNDEHARSHMRAKITAKNMKDYSRAFNCPKGSKMNPEKKCSIWQ